MKTIKSIFSFILNTFAFLAIVLTAAVFFSAAAGICAAVILVMYAHHKIKKPKNPELNVYYAPFNPLLSNQEAAAKAALKLSR